MKGVARDTRHPFSYVCLTMETIRAKVTGLGNFIDAPNYRNVKYPRPKRFLLEFPTLLTFASAF